MQPKLLTILLCLTIVICGCTAPIEESIQTEVPLQLSFTADTLERDEDGGSLFDLKEALDSKPVLMLWIAAGCSGCHDWTDMLRESINNGTINTSSVSIISMHRWSEVESPATVMKAFGNDDNDSNYTPWPIVLPNESSRLTDFETGETTQFSVVEGFGNPVTPTVQLIGQDGIKMWQSKSYWANYTMVEEAMDVVNKIAG
ncbi:MAG: hypothetical protein ISP82_02790 [Candidatus Poseidoniaceae archaeon]|nr:hypothetical protein [Candidatus Poseidoniaceae archaeon]MBL6896269.1 hypothetical protein [Candidatus Poseidoniaceae archaeon]